MSRRYCFASFLWALVCSGLVIAQQPQPSGAMNIQTKSTNPKVRF